MKNALLAMVCTLGAVACGGNSRPAEDPATTTTTTTTETTETTAAGARRAPVTVTGARTGTGTPGTGTGTGTSTGTSATNTDGLDMTRPSHDAPAVGGNAPENTSAPATTATTATDNAGVANGTKDATNTKINDRDRHGALTPMDQGGGNDRDITAAVRRAVVGDKALSFTAKNVKIITVGGKVTLRGPVKSDEEKSSIEAKAKSTAGVSSVDNQLEVKK